MQNPHMNPLKTLSSPSATLWSTELIIYATASAKLSMPMASH